jgi:hypothetical protein
MSIYLQDQPHHFPIRFTPETKVRCRNCGYIEHIKGTQEVEFERGDDLDFEDVVSSLEAAMEVETWQHGLCGACWETSGAKILKYENEEDDQEHADDERYDV